MVSSSMDERLLFWSSFAKSDSIDSVPLSESLLSGSEDPPLLALASRLNPFRRGRPTATVRDRGPAAAALTRRAPSLHVQPPRASQAAW